MSDFGLIALCTSGSAGRNLYICRNERNGGSKVLHDFLLPMKLMGTQMKRMMQMVCSNFFRLNIAKELFKNTVIYLLSLFPSKKNKNPVIIVLILLYCLIPYLHF